MVYAYDRNILMPTKDLYDTQIMAMALNVAKDEYNKAEKRLDDLTKLYSDFYSPSDVDMASWQREVVNPIKNQIDDLYARGIDPLRSAEGHALLAKVSRNLPYDDMNMLKQSSKVLQKNLENAAELQAKNLYDPEYVKFLDRDPKTWDTLKRGVFLWASPSPAYSMETLISPMYKDRQARPLTQEEVEGEGVVYDPMKNYTGFLKSDIRKVAEENLPSFLNTPDGRFQKWLAAQQVANESGIRPEDVDDADANAKLLDNMVGPATRFYIAPNGEVDKIKLENRKLANSGIRSSYASSSSTSGGSYGGGGGNNGSASAYSTKVRMFNEGIANLLGINVDVIETVLPRGKFVYDRIVNNQTAIVNRRASQGKYADVIEDLAQLTPTSISQVAEILELKQTGDEDKKNGIYTLPKSELRNIVDASYILSDIKTADPVNAGINDTETKRIRNYYSRATRDKLKIVPSGRVVTYMDKNGIVKKYAEAEVLGKGQFGGQSSEIVYIDLGNNSTVIDGSDNPVFIDNNRSTLRDRGYMNIDKKDASNKTQTIYTDYGTPVTK